MRPVALPLVQSLLAAAAQKAEAGHLAEAERLLHQLLSLVPRHAEALHLLGVIAYQTERRDLALDVIDKALAANPNDPSSIQAVATCCDSRDNWRKPPGATASQSR